MLVIKLFKINLVILFKPSFPALFSDSGRIKNQIMLVIIDISAAV